MCVDDQHPRPQAPGPSQTLTGRSVFNPAVCESVGSGSATVADGRSQALSCAYVCIGRSNGKQGPIAQSFYGSHPGAPFTDVRVDHFGSLVDNPFTGGCQSTLCRAYDELVRMVLATLTTIRSCIEEYDALMPQSACAILQSPTAFELDLLRAVADKYCVSLHGQVSPPLAIKPWLAYHAKLLLEGASIRLLDARVPSCHDIPPWTCHAQSLQGALLWVAVTYQSEFASLCPPSVEHIPLHSQVGVMALHPSFLFTCDPRARCTDAVGLSCFHLPFHSHSKACCMPASALCRTPSQRCLILEDSLSTAYRAKLLQSQPWR